METGEGKGNTAPKNLARPPEIKTIKLNDGKEYELAPVDINLLADVEDKFGQPFGKISEGGRVKPIRYLLWLRLKGKYPEIDTEERLGSMVDLDTLYKLSEVLEAL